MSESGIHSPHGILVGFVTPLLQSKLMAWRIVALAEADSIRPARAHSFRPPPRLPTSMEDRIGPKHDSLFAAAATPESDGLPRVLGMRPDAHSLGGVGHPHKWQCLFRQTDLFDAII